MPDMARHPWWEVHDPGPWAVRAACSGQFHIFDKTVRNSGGNPQRTYVRAVAEAKAICVGCPVIVQCRLHGMKYEPYGVWGGLAQEERPWGGGGSNGWSRARRMLAGRSDEEPSSSRSNG